ncbi:hypothetical protein XK26_04145 [Streptococcus suis]|nr:hypothetical protein XK26_04145 [Streptococcus suis]
MPALLFSVKILGWPDQRSADQRDGRQIQVHHNANIGITEANLSILKTGKAKGIRFNTLMSICRILDCQPGDILEYVKE